MARVDSSSLVVVVVVVSVVEPLREDLFSLVVALLIVLFSERATMDGWMMRMTYSDNENF